MVNLPLMSTSNPNLPFSEISGVRFTKHEQDGNTSVILDLTSSRSLHVSIRFPFNGWFSSMAIDQVVESGTPIMRAFVGEANGDETNGD